MNRTKPNNSVPFFQFYANWKMFPHKWSQRKFSFFTPTDFFLTANFLHFILDFVHFIIFHPGGARRGATVGEQSWRRAEAVARGGEQKCCRAILESKSWSYCAQWRAEVAVAWFQRAEAEAVAPGGEQKLLSRNFRKQKMKLSRNFRE